MDHQWSRRETVAGFAAFTSGVGQAGANGKYELFKTTQHFDATAQNPQWLGGETQQVESLIKSAS